MGLADRHYMRQAGGDFRWSATVTIIVINVVAFILQNTVLRTVDLERYAYLSLRGLQHGYVWQLLTFQLLHGGFLHILFNSLAIYFFGRPVEMIIGRSRFFTLYFGSGVVGGITHALFALALPQYFNAAVLGASAGAFGLLAAFAVINWYEQFTLLFYFILPIRMRGRTFFWAALILTVISLSIPGGSVAYTAHLGGLLAGFAWIKLGWHHDYRRLPWEGWFARFRGWRPFGNKRPRQRELVRATKVKTHRWPISKTDSPEPTEEEFISSQVDPILDKISAHGIQSLSPREREILEAARKKMERR